MSRSYSFQPDLDVHDAAVSALYARAFGPGRHAKAAARLREGNQARRDLSFLAFDADQLLGACRLWPVASATSEALFLGPIAVEDHQRGAGLGRALVQTCLQAVDNLAAETAVILVGDAPFFGPLGFEVIPDGQIRLPGPVDPKRLLWRVGSKTCLPQGLLRLPAFAPPGRQP